jgi:hypothetical protein
MPDGTINTSGERENETQLHKAAAGIFDSLPEDPFGEGEDEEPTGQQEDQDPDAGAEDDDDVDTEDESEDDDEDDESEDDDEDEDEDDEDDDDEAEGEADEEDDEDGEELYTVKVDGEVMEKTLDELRAGFSRTESWTRKSQKLSDERKAFEGERETVKRMEAEYAARLQTLETQMAGNLPQEPSPQDPQAWIRYRQEMDALSQVQAERIALQERMQAEHRKEREVLIQAENEKLEEIYPEWQDKEQAVKDKRSLATFAVGVLGFEETDIEQIVDHRVVMLLRMARDQHELSEAKGKVKSKTKKAKKVLKPGKTSNRSASQKSKSKRSKAARAQLKSSGHVKDAAAFIHDNLLD